jgi:hypothetical protein
VALVVWRTANLSGRSAMNCLRCKARVEFLHGMQLVSIDNGATVLVYDASDLGTLHRCGREQYLYCESCEHEVELDDCVGRGRRSIRGRRIHGFELRHGLCDGEVYQRERTAR